METSPSDASVRLTDFSGVTKYPEVKILSVHSSTLLHLHKWAVTKRERERGREGKKSKNTPSNVQSEKLTGLASLSEGQAFWVFEGRIGRGSCKLPNNLSALCAALDITVFQVYLDHTEAFDADPSPGWITSWKKALLCYSTVKKQEDLNSLHDVWET